MTSSIPEQLTALPQWVTWRYETRGSKATKVPYTPGTQRRASSTQSSTWTTYDTALADRTSAGIGFVFSADDAFVGIDLDDCLDSDGVLSKWAADIIASLPPTYTEISPSGNGLKMFLIGEWPADGKHRCKIEDGEIEVYDRGRFFTVTGERWQDAPCVVAQANLSALYARYFKDRDAPAAGDRPERGGGFSGSNEAMIEAIRRSRSGRQFAELYDNEPSGDHSAADLALCNILAFWCGPDPKRIDNVFRGSRLYREKWDARRGDRTYGQITIEQALAGRVDFYQPADAVRVNEDSEAIERARCGRPFMMTDTGNAERLAANFKGRIRHCEKSGGWYVWTGEHWKRDDTNQIVYFAIRTVREIHAEASQLSDEKPDKHTDSPAQAMHKHATRSEAQARIAAMIRLASALPGVAIESGEFDKDPWLFNCINGTIDLRTGELMPHDPANNITKIGRAAYHPSAKAPLWAKFLSRIFDGNVEMIDYVQDLLGMCLSGDVSEQIMPVFFGHGSNGKSTLLDTVVEVMGTYAGKAAPDLLMARQGEVHPTEVADLWGLRLAVASETEENHKLRSAKIKEMTGDAELKARFMRGDYFDFRRTHKLILMTNHKPRVSDDSHGMWRRLKLVPFTAVITDAERDKDLGTKLRDNEWTGILSWLVAGCRRWYERGGLDDPAEVREATGSYREDEDPLVEFCDSLAFGPELFISNADLRKIYTIFCKNEGIAFPLAERSLVSRLADRPGVERARIRMEGRQVRGLKGVGKPQEQAYVEDDTGRVAG